MCVQSVLHGCDNICTDPTQYEVTYDGGHTVISYGRLDQILVCDLGPDAIWGELRNTSRVLALVTPCQTYGADASKDVIEFRAYAQPVITDIRNVKATVGHVETRRRWGIIDRSTSLVNAVFDNQDAMAASSEEDVVSDGSSSDDF